MAKVNDEKILNMALRPLKVSKRNKVKTEITKKVNNLSNEGFSLDELEILEQITQEQIEEDRNTTAASLSYVALVTSTIFAIVSAVGICFTGPEEGPRDVITLTMFVVFMLFIICLYMVYEIPRMGKISARTDEFARLRTAILFYKNKLLSENEQADGAADGATREELCAVPDIGIKEKDIEQVPVTGSGSGVSIEKTSGATRGDVRNENPEIKEYSIITERALGREEDEAGIIIKMHKNGFTPEQIADATDEKIEEVKAILAGEKPDLT